MLERDTEQLDLGEVLDEDDPMPDLGGHSITYRIAVGPHRGRKVFTLQTLPTCDEEDWAAAGPGNVAGFSLHAAVAVKACQRDKLERLCRNICRPPVAIPLLQRAQSVRIVRLPDVAEEDDRAGCVDRELIRHLERHGVRPEFTCLPHRDAPKGERILAFARQAAVDLIVAGGYGHPRAFEHVFGGVTRTLLRESPVPVFFSH